MAARPKSQPQTDPAHQQLVMSFEAAPLQLMSVEDIYLKADATLLTSLSEDRRIERKSAKFSGDGLGDYFSMWANTAPDGGVIVLGQRDKGELEGCSSLDTKELNQRETAGYTYCPDARYDVKRVPVTNSAGQPDFVLLFRIQYSNERVVRTTAGKAFLRRGDRKIELKPEEIRELEADKGTVSIEQENSRLSWPQDFDTAAVQTFVEAVRTRRGLSDALSAEEILELRHLGRRIQPDLFVPNVACVLLFALDPLRSIPGCKIRFQRFEGEHEQTGTSYNAVKDLFLEGTVPELIRQAEVVLESQLRTFSPLDNKVKFFPVQEYPKEAWYEAIVNACVHRSYGNGMKNMPIFVKMFDDRLVIESPGPLPPFVTPLNIYDTHQPRNPMLMDAMFYLTYVKCAHEGTRRIRDTMRSMNLPQPEFRLEEQGPAVVKVTLRNNVKQRRAWIDSDVSNIISEAMASALTEEERRVLNYAAANGQVTISDINKALDISWKRAQKLLLRLAGKTIFQYIRFRKFGKDLRDPKAFFRLRSQQPLPEGAFEHPVSESGL